MVIKEAIPMGSSVILTKNRWGIDDAPKGLIVNPKKLQGSLKDYQTVVAVGPGVANVKVGDTVMFTLDNYAKFSPAPAGAKMRKGITGEDGSVFEGYEVPNIEIDGVDYMVIKEHEITFIIKIEEDKPDSGIIHMQPQIIKP